MPHAVRRHRGLPAAARAAQRSWPAKGAQGGAENLIVTTGSQQALDLLGKTLVSPGDKVIVEGPTFLTTIQCFRLYGAQLISAPIDGNGVKTDELEKLIVEHRPKFVYLIPTFGNPSGAMLELERRKKVLELAVKYQTLVVEDDPHGDLYFGTRRRRPACWPSAIEPGSPVAGALRQPGARCRPWPVRVGWMIARRVAGCHHVPESSATRTPAPLPGHGRAQYLRPAACPARWPMCARCTPGAPRATGDALRKRFGRRDRVY